MRRLMLVCFGLFLPVLLWSAQTQERERFKVTGRVVNSATGEPVRGALVQINGQEPHSTMAGADGRFEMDGLLGGVAYVYAQRPGFSPNQPQNILVSSATDAVVVKLIPFSKISGRITDPDGEPIEGIQVRSMSEMIMNGRKQWQTAGSASSDETGHFVIENLAAGSYVLETREALLYLAAQPKSEAARYIYPQTFHPDTSNRELAQKIELAAGDEMRLDVTLHSIRGARVSFVTEPNYRNLFATISNGDIQFGNMGAQTDDTGRLTFSAVPPGNWKIEVRGPFSGPEDKGSQQMYGELPVEVGKTDIDDLKVLLGKLPDIQVLVSDGAKSGISLQLFSSNNQTYGGPSDEGGNFVLRSVIPGAYRVVPQPRGACIASLMSGSVNLLQEELVVSGLSSVPPIQITKGDNCASLTIAAKAKTPASVIVTSNWKTFEPWVVGASEQGATIGGLHEGEYKIYALDDITDLEYANPDAMRNFKSQTVTLDAGQKLSLQVEVEERHPK
jgi:protocatechuate 3,4-dioxygenase beta subunit